MSDRIMHDLYAIVPNMSPNAKLESITIVSDSTTMTLDVKDVRNLIDVLQDCLDSTVEKEPFIGPTKL